MDFQTLEWFGDAHGGHLRLLDQSRLPEEETYLGIFNVEDLADAIRRLSVRGAPAIGIAAAYGMVIAGQSAAKKPNSLNQAHDILAKSRPTAINLFWALERMKKVWSREAFDAQELPALLLAEAKNIHDEDRDMCRRIGENGLPLISDGAGILTHCNAGALATGGIGTALAVITTAHAKGKKIRAYMDETRPLLQGSRLTAWELTKAKVPATLICDSMAGLLMREGKISLVVTGADRVAANGDAANKIGTYSVAVLAKAHGIPFYIAAPHSTFDFTMRNGGQIPIEERGSGEITHGFGRQTAPEGVQVFNPAFDVTPAELISGFITEKGIFRPPYGESLRGMK